MLPYAPAGQPAALVTAQGLVLRRSGRAILDGVDIAVEAGEIVTLMGPNGAGKSSLIRILLGLVASDAGQVVRRPRLRIGYSPQLLPLDPILPLTVRRFLTLGLPADRELLAATLSRVSLGDILARQMTALSGGELRRVVLARALLRRPELLVLDEPVSGVDVAGQVALYELIARIRDDTGAGILLVSHDLHLVMARTDRVLCLDGHICCAGRPLEVAGNPAFQRLFGRQLSDVMAVYRHHRDHHHHNAPHGHHHAALEAGEAAG